MAQTRLADAIRNRDTAFLDDLMRNSRGTSPRTNYLLQTDAAGLPIPDRRFFGQAMELQLRRQIRANPALQSAVSEGSYIYRVANGRTYRGFTDFELNIGETSVIIDLTTPASAAAHYERFYSENALVITCGWPF